MDIKQVQETIEMIEEQNFDIRTITMGISLLDCIDTDIDRVAAKVYDKVVAKASKLVEVGDEIASELGRTKSAVDHMNTRLNKEQEVI